jgi:hypothetical protein
MGSADESTTGPASLMLFDRYRSRLPAVANEEGRQPADLEEQNGGKNVTPPPPSASPIKPAHSSPARVPTSAPCRAIRSATSPC